MLVIIANKLPDAVRGLLKVWCLEPKPNVFVTDIDDRKEKKIEEFLTPYFKESTGLLIIKSNKKSIQGMEIRQTLTPTRRELKMSGLSLILEKNGTS